MLIMKPAEQYPPLKQTMILPLQTRGQRTTENNSGFVSTLVIGTLIYQEHL